jgi:predicted  nucleic acid-binding Zn-ribbon protein
VTPRAPAAQAGGEGEQMNDEKARMEHRIATLEAALAASRTQSAQLAAALKNLVRQFAEDGQEPNSEDLEFMFAIGQARTALAAWQQANK